MWQGWRIRTRIFGGIRKIGCNLPNRDMDRRKGMEEKRGKVKGTVKGLSRDISGRNSGQEEEIKKEDQW